MHKEKVVILGGLRSGVGAAILAKQKGYTVFVSDYGPIAPKFQATLQEEGIEFEEKQHTLPQILQADLIVKSPGIPEKAAVIKAIRKQGIPIISEIEFAGRFTSAKIIGITGSNGKTTTTSLIYHLLKTAGYSVGLVGNIGDSFALSVAQEQYDYYVVEISSFQLDDIADFRSHIAILTNLTPDHLDRYNYLFDKYIAAKFNIIKNQQPTDYFIYNQEDKVIQEKIKNVTIVGQQWPFAIKEIAKTRVTKEVIKITEDCQIPKAAYTLKGKHNLYNALAAVTAAHLVGVAKDMIIKGLQSFQALEHRLETVQIIEEVTFINDSKATNIDSTWYALDAMNQQTIWIVGGVDKGNDYTTLLNLVKEKVKGIICLGKDNEKILSSFAHLSIPLLETTSMEKAVQMSQALAQKEAVVLLSPACASFDLFANYEDRGKKFKKAVNNLLVNNV